MIGQANIGQANQLLGKLKMKLKVKEHHVRHHVRQAKVLNIGQANQPKMDLLLYIYWHY
jgi:hypothetical protein